MKIYMLLAFIILTPILCTAQSAERIFDFHPLVRTSNMFRDKDGKSNLTDDNVLELIETKVENKNINLGQKFTAADDWMKTLTVKVKNVSEKEISRIEMSFIFLETKSEKNSYSGSWIGYSALDAETGELDERKLVKPNETVELNKTRYEEIKQRMKESNLTTLNEVYIAYFRVYFKDGSYWSSTRLPQISAFD